MFCLRIQQALCFLVRVSKPVYFVKLMKRQPYQTDIDKEKIRQRQQLAIIAIVRSGVITCHDANKNIPQQYKDDLHQIDEFLFNAQEAWGLSKDDERIVIDLLKIFQMSLRISKLADTDDMVTTIALSQVAIDALRDCCGDDKLPYVLPIVDALARFGNMLCNGMKDKYLIEKSMVADEIAGLLYKIIGFEE